GKTILITGASFGIGRACAERLAATGAQLLLVARTAAALAEVQELVTAQGGRAESLPCDLTQPAEVAALLQHIAATYGGVDLVISNAGKSIRRSIFASLDRLHDFQRTMNLNYFGPVQLLLGLLPGLVERRGQIINISAVNVRLLPPPQWAAYQASKAAFDQWLRAVTPEVRVRGVATSTLYLPLVRTRMIEPTAAYRSLPALTPDEVAQLLCRAIVERRSSYAPWWLPAGELASVLLRRPLEWLMTTLMTNTGEEQ
ncbi:MAG: SDR family NAD(P)-dependent oxidoreductase, partial [Caldilineaceae bacterium]|nr:SDR family NAD(P)-dependent oxidoreductase [Caldilineaceae bacterium]